jgi:hypothetical protein
MRVITIDGAPMCIADVVSCPVRQDDCCGGWECSHTLSCAQSAMGKGKIACRTIGEDNFPPDCPLKEVEDE